MLRFQRRPLNDHSLEFYESKSTLPSSSIRVAVKQKYIYFFFCVCVCAHLVPCAADEYVKGTQKTSPNKESSRTDCFIVSTIIFILLTLPFLCASYVLFFGSFNGHGTVSASFPRIPPSLPNASVKLPITSRLFL